MLDAAATIGNKSMANSNANVDAPWAAYLVAAAGDGLGRFDVSVCQRWPHCMLEDEAAVQS